jgi:arsenate reductase
MKPTVLILCTGNSCRSHMGEGILRALAGDLLEAQSAGSRPAGYVHPVAVEVMREIGIDISGHESKSLDKFMHQQVHTVITVCGNVDQICPTFPGQVQRIHHGFDDPAHAEGTPEEIRAAFRRVRDEIRRFLSTFAMEFTAP